MTVISVDKREQVLVRVRGKGKPSTPWVIMQISATTMTNTREVLQKIKNSSTRWPSNPCSECLSTGNENTNSERYTCSHIHWNIIYNNQNIGTTKVVSIDTWVDKDVNIDMCVCVCIEILFNHLWQYALPKCHYSK